ncbi:MAG: hypothetical protein HOP13_20240 [Alphaproteobacteria bacterium]|nr:hypothetical protein [Alphaproteobacteria bacterium]
MTNEQPQSHWTWFYENVWLLGVPRDWRVLSAYSLLLLIVTAFLVLMVAQGDRHGLPDRQQLRELRGVANFQHANKYSVIFKLEPWKPRFDYPSKARYLTDVVAALQAGGDATVLVDGTRFVDEEDQRTTVYALTVNGKTIRSFEDVERSWQADNRVSYWLLAFFAPGTLALAATALHEYRRSRLG